MSGTTKEGRSSGVIREGIRIQLGYYGSYKKSLVYGTMIWDIVPETRR